MSRYRKYRRSGVAAVEFAVVLPVVVLLFWGTIEIANLITKKAALQNVVREVARHAITARATSTSANKLFTNAINNSGVKNANFTIVPADFAKAKPGAIVTVEATAPYSVNSIVSGFLNLSSMKASVAMRKD